MAYPTANAAGMIPINLIGGQVFAGATRQIPIGSSSATAIYTGDVVKMLNTGLLTKEAGTDSFTAPIGVFMGCTYTDATFGKVFRQYYPATTVASDIVAYVVDDPDTLFKVAVVSTGTTISYVNRTAVGENAVLVQTAGSTLIGNSQNGVSSTTATTSTWPLRIVDVIPETQTATAGSYTEVVVKFNMPSDGATGGHVYYRATGV